MRLRLLELRLAEGLTQSDVARKLGCTRQRVADLEKGVTTFVELDALARLSALFGVPVGELFEAIPVTVD